MNIEDDCERTDALLPWYVNGSLEGEAQAVRAHLAACARCRSEAEWLATVGGHLRDASHRGSGGSGTPSASFSTLLQHIAADEQRRQRSWLALAAALLLTIAVTLGLVLSWQPLAPRYHTVTDAVPVAGRTTLIEVELAPAAPASSLRDVLERHGAVIVAGPDAEGRFRLEFPLQDGEDSAALARDLQAEPDVMHAVPVTRAD